MAMSSLKSSRALGTLARQLGAVATGSFQLTFLLGLTLICAILLCIRSCEAGSIPFELQECSLVPLVELSLLRVVVRLGLHFPGICAQLIDLEVSRIFQGLTGSLFLKQTC